MVHCPPQLTIALNTFPGEKLQFRRLRGFRVGEGRLGKRENMVNHGGTRKRHGEGEEGECGEE